MQQTLLRILHFKTESATVNTRNTKSVTGRCNETVTSTWEQNKKTIEKILTGFLPCQDIRLNVSSD